LIPPIADLLVSELNSERRVQMHDQPAAWQGLRSTCRGTTDRQQCVQASNAGT